MPANAMCGEDPIDPVATTLSTPRPHAAAVVVMGVSGSGKSTVGAALADRLGWIFVDGDSLHPAANVAKMQAGQPLDDRDREPWLTAIAGQIDAWIRHGTPGVITCSALRRRYRDRIIGDRADVRLIYLAGTREVIARRLSARHGHFMPASLLDSQFATLEPPEIEENAIAVDIDRPIISIVDRIVTSLSPQITTMVASS
ncbi:MAG TPA: gluconokinase [Stellaceae bacterium]|nr:gluconokinase [Stellaceae bacterium]